MGGLGTQFSRVCERVLAYRNVTAAYTPPPELRHPCVNAAPLGGFSPFHTRALIHLTTSQVPTRTDAPMNLEFCTAPKESFLPSRTCIII